MICKNCNSEMDLDDVDYSEGDKDKYWICNKCNIGCIEKIRINKDTIINWVED